MQTSGIHQFQTVFLLLLAFVVLFTLLARRLNTPYPILLVLAGLAIGFVPGMPSVALDPEIIFLVVLPPLLYSSAWTTSWREFKFHLVSIVMLALGLVGFTVLAVALIAPEFLPHFDWRLGFILGAIIAPTDAIAATAIARRIGLPGRIVEVLEGESLLNDASGLLALELGLTMVVSGQTPTVGGALLRFAWLTVGGIGIGLLAGIVIDRLERYIEDGPIEIVLSVLIPYVTYIAADSAHASGVLAVVACGLFLSRRSAVFFSPNVRLQAWAVWESLTFALNGIVFVLIGLQLPFVLSVIRGYTIPLLLLYGGGFSAAVILIRLLWTFPGARFAYLIRSRVLHQKVSTPPARQVFVVGWTGMRGVVSLAAALSLPVALRNGTPFPGREMIVYLTFSVILTTLVLQGLTLPPLIRFLGLSEPTTGPNCEEWEARRIMLSTALSHLEETRLEAAPEIVEVYDDLAGHYRQRLSQYEAVDGDSPSSLLVQHLRLSLELLHVERETALQLRGQGRISDDVLRRIERELDLSEAKFTSQ